MDIQTRFKSGNTVYFIEPRTIYEPLNTVCPACNGKGRITIHGVEFDCRTRFIHKGSCECRFGMLVRCKYEWCVSKYQYRIDRVIVQEEDNEVEVSYLLDDNSEHDESLCFATEEEAQAACDLKNGGN